MFQTLRDGVEWLYDKIRTRPRQIKDLSATESAAYASRIYKQAGRTILAARFIYHTLHLDDQQPEALLRLADYYRTGSRDDTPSETLVYAALAIKRGRSHVAADSPIAQELEVAQLRLLWEWKYATYSKGADVMPGDFTDPSQFNIDDLGFIRMLSVKEKQIGSASRAFSLIHTLIGVRAGLLKPAKKHFLSAPRSPDSLPAYDFSANYRTWLRTPLSSVIL